MAFFPVVIGPLPEMIGAGISAATIALTLLALIFLLPIASIVTAALSRNILVFTWSFLLSLGALRVAVSQPSSTWAIMAAICMQLGALLIGMAGMRSHQRAKAAKAAALRGKIHFSRHRAPGRHGFGRPSRPGPRQDKAA
jgi:hypothetical protein